MKKLSRLLLLVPLVLTLASFTYINQMNYEYFIEQEVSSRALSDDTLERLINEYLKENYDKLNEYSNSISSSLTTAKESVIEVRCIKNNSFTPHKGSAVIVKKTSNTYKMVVGYETMKECNGLFEKVLPYIEASNGNIYPIDVTKLSGNNTKFGVFEFTLEGGTDKDTNEEFTYSELTPIDLFTGTLEYGQTVFSIGYQDYDPYEETQDDPSPNIMLTTTMGILSSLDSDADLNDNGSISLDEKEFIQHDAAINTRMYGGALVNDKGQLIGINVGKLSLLNDNEYTVNNLNFAVSIAEFISYI